VKNSLLIVSWPSILRILKHSYSISRVKYIMWISVHWNISKKHKRNEDYGFTCMSEKHGTQRLQCKLWNRVGCSLLQIWNLQDLMNILIVGTGVSSLGMISIPWKGKGHDLIKGGTLLKQGFVSVTSYQVAFLRDKNRRPHTVAGELVKPRALRSVA